MNDYTLNQPMPLPETMLATPTEYHEIPLTDFQLDPVQSSRGTDRVTDILAGKAAATQQPQSYGYTPVPSDMQMTRANPFQMQAQQQSTAADQIKSMAASGDVQATQTIKAAGRIVDPSDAAGTDALLQYWADHPDNLDPSNSYQMMTSGARFLRETGYKSPKPLTPEQLSMQDMASIASGKGTDYFGRQQEDLKNIANIDLLSGKASGKVGGGSGGVTQFVYNKTKAALESAGVTVTPEMEMQIISASRNGLQKGSTITVNGKQIGIGEIMGATDFAAAMEQATRDASNQSDVNYARPKAEQTALGTPIPESAMKDALESESIATQLGGVNADLAEIRKGIGGDDLALGPAENMQSRIKNWAAMSDPNSQNYASLVATLEQQRNASLLLAKGVQTEGDATRAWNQLMANLNDANNVAQRLDEIQAINERSARLKMKQSNAMKENYGRPPTSFDEAFRQPPSVSMAPPAIQEPFPGFSNLPPDRQKRYLELQKKQ